MTALAKTENAEVKAMRHAADAFDRLADDALLNAEEHPSWREFWLREASRLRVQATAHRNWAKREEEWHAAQAVAAMEAETA